MNLARQALAGLQIDTTQSIDVVDVLRMLAVPIGQVRLTDQQVRGVVIGYPRAAPHVLTNRTCEYNSKTNSRRFTLAHELCHVLYDQGQTRPLGILDGPWAELIIEQRANAFAAWFLMPVELVNAKAAAIIEERGEVDEVRLAREMDTSRSATREHLSNLRRMGLLNYEVSTTRPRQAGGRRRVPD